MKSMYRVLRVLVLTAVCSGSLAWANTITDPPPLPPPPAPTDPQEEPYDPGFINNGPFGETSPVEQLPPPPSAPPSFVELSAPEPGTLPLVMTGLAMASWAVRRRSRRT